MQLVLDTNVWIDWLVFDDPAIALLKSAHRNGQITILIDDACLGELNAVLAYPEFRLNDEQKAHHLAEVARHTIRHDSQPSAFPLPLPRCSDPDDQKFLTLAFDAAADWLLTRDKALLKVNRRLQAKGCRVGSPAQWSAACGDLGGHLHSTQVAASTSLARAVR